MLGVSLVQYLAFITGLGIAGVPSLFSGCLVRLCCCFASVVYDCSSRETFDNMSIWLNELDTYATKKNIVRMLVGNKIDKVRCR